MSREIDERIVAMYLDNSDFERNASKTLKTLDELKSGLDMKGVEKGLDVFDKAKDKLNLDKATESVSKFKTAMSGLGKILKKVYVDPFTHLEKSFEKFRKNYLNKIIGFDIADKLARSFENALRSLTISPISAGWKQYESTMDSVRTIMSSTGEDIDTVKAKLAQMTSYANETIYSLTDMTSNLGKFTNNGVKLDDATRAMIGLANATADAGQGAQQASIAMYNASQAIGVGKMTSIDWKSFENANIATTRLKQTFIDAAVAAGQLEKKITTVNGEEVIEYWTKAANGQKAIKVTAENFRETLSNGWLTKEAMMTAYSIYSGQLSVEEIAALGFNEADAARLWQLGQDAMAAAKEVRTLSKMMDALAESVQSSWAQSFEYIFGDMEEGTNFWTELNNRIDSVLSAGAEARNNILMAWRGMMMDEDGNVHKIEEVYNRRKQMLYYDLEHGYISQVEFDRRMQQLESTIGDPALWVDHREMLLESIYDLFDIVKNIAGAVKGAWSDVFGEFNADALKSITDRFRDFVGRVKEWLGSADDADSRLGKIRKGLAGLFRIAKAGLTIFKSIAEVAWNLIKPILDPIIDLFGMTGDWLDLGLVENLGDAIKKLGEKFGGLWEKLKSLGWKGAFEKIGSWIGNVWKNIKTGVRTWLEDNGLEGVVEWFRTVKSKILEGWGIVERWWNNEDNVLRITFQGIWDAVAGVFEYDEEGEMPIVRFFKSIPDAVSTAFGSVQEWWNGDGNIIREFFEGVWDTVSGWFKVPEDAYNNAYPNLLGKYLEGGLSTEDFVSGKAAIAKQGGNIPIVQFFLNIYDGIIGAYHSIDEWWNSGSNPLHELLDNAVATVRSWFQSVNGEEAPIVKFFKGIWEGLKGAWDTLVSFIETSGIGDFISNAWNWILEKIGISSGTSESGKSRDITEGIAANISGALLGFKSFVNIFDRGAFGGLGSFTKGFGLESAAVGMGDGISALVGAIKTEDAELATMADQVPIVAFFLRIRDAIVGAWNTIVGWEGWADVGKFFSDVWGWLSDLVGTVFETLTKEREVTNIDKATSETVTETKSLLDIIFEFIGSVVEKIGDFIASLKLNEISDAMLGTIESLLNGIWGLVDIFARWLERITTGEDRNGQKLDTVSDIVVPLLVVALGIVMKFFEMKKTTNLAKIAETGSWMSDMGGQILKIALGIGILAVAVRYLGSMDTESLIKGGLAILALGAVIAGIVVVLGIFRKENSNNDSPVTGLERVVNRIVSVLGLVLSLKIVADTLPTIIDALSKAKTESGLTGEDVKDTLVGMALTMAAILVAVSLMARILPDNLDMGVAIKAIIIAWIAIGISIGSLFATGGLFDSITGLLTNMGAIDSKYGNNSFAYMADMSEHFVTIMENLGKGIGSFAMNISGIPTLIGAIGNTVSDVNTSRAEDNVMSMEAMVDKMTGTDNGVIDRVVRVMAMINRTAQTAKDVTGADFSYVGKLMADIGKGIIDFYNIINGFAAEHPEFDINSDEVMDMFTGGFAIAEEFFKMLSSVPNIGYSNNGNLAKFMEFFGEGSSIQSQAIGWNYEDVAINETDNLETLFNVIGRIISAYNQLSVNIEGLGDGSSDRIQSAITFVSEIFESFGNFPMVYVGRFNEFIEFYGNQGNLTRFFDTIRGIADSANDIPEIKARGVIRGVFDLIQEAMDAPDAQRTFDASSIILAIVDALHIGRELIADAAMSMVQEGISLIGTDSAYNFDMSSVFNLIKGGSITGTDDFVTKVLESFSGEGGIDGAISSVEDMALTKAGELAGVFGENGELYTQYINPALGKVEEIKKQLLDLTETTNTLSFGGMSLTDFMADEDGNGVADVLDQMQTSLEGMEETELRFRPVLVLDGFGGEVQALRDYMAGETPIDIKGVFDIGDTGLKIDDSSVVSEIRGFRTAMQTSQMLMLSSIRSTTDNLGSRIDNLNGAISNLKLYLDTNRLIGGIISGIDAGLYQRSIIAAQTGVTKP